MEFKFSVNDVFKTPFVEIDHSLIPPGFSGDKRTFWDVVGKVSEVINAMGEASAAAQGLTKPITTAERLRNSEQKVYLLIDKTAGNGRGAVTGMLKTGKKGLYVFDRNGQHYQVSPPCVLDFYVHESRQRTGLGKRLFEHMLQTENIEPVKMAIDRPSDKFLGFLNKHYTLKEPVKQMNNYVVFDGFFPSSPEKNGTVEQDHSGGTPGKKQSANGLQTSSYTSPWGRYGAPKPPCSMGQIIHNQTSTIPKNTEPTGVTSVRSAPETNYQHVTVNSPGNPANVTQSTPNMYYRAPEQQQNLETIQNQQYQYQTANNPNDLKYYQQLQSNNVWQSLGSVPPNSINNQNKTNFNRHVTNNQEPYQGDQQITYGDNQQLQNPGQQQNYMNQSREGIIQQPPAVEGQSQTMYQNTSQYVNSNTQGYMPQAQNLQQFPSQYIIPNAYPVVQNFLPQVPSHTLIPNEPQQILAQNNIPQMQGNAFSANQLQQMVPQSAPQMEGNIMLNPINQPQQMMLRNDGQHVQNVEPSQPRNAYGTIVQNSILNEPLLSQQNTANIQNSDKSLVRQNHQAVPQHNVIGYGPLPPQFSSLQINQSLPNATVQPSATQVVPQYNNQMVLNQPQHVYNVTNETSHPNLAPSANVYEPQNTLTNQILQSNVVPNANIQNQVDMGPQVPQPSVPPETNILGQPINLPQQNVSATNLANEKYTTQNYNQASHVPNTLSQTNTNMVTSSNMVQTQNMTPRTALSRQRINSAQVTQPQTNTFNQNRMTPQIPQHMEGSQLNNSNANQEIPPIHDAKGDMKPIANDDEMFKYGYPPQVLDSVKRTVRSPLLSVAGR